MGGIVMLTRGGGCGGGNGRATSKSAGAAADCGEHQKQEEEQLQQQLSLLDFLIAALRKSKALCNMNKQEEMISTVHHMEIGWPKNVQHIAHVTFDRFQGFLGLPVEFEVEIPRRVPSASVSVFGVSADSMQCSYDKRGNSVPTILLLMQERLYAQCGLQAEGIFRINPENRQEEQVREQLNRGVVPDDIDIHYLAGLIKAWFRELPSGVLDGLSPEQVLQCKTEEEFVRLVRQLRPMESALLQWATDLMADVVEHEVFNKMNARNIAVVFAPNMTQMSDPLTALMHAIQVMNLLKTLIVKTLREREDEAASPGDYSPTSSRSRETDDEREDIGSAGAVVSDEEERSTYTQTSPYQEGAESLSDAEEEEEEEERFSRPLRVDDNARDEFRKRLEGILCKDHVSPGDASTFVGDSCIALPESHASSEFGSSSDEEEEEPRKSSAPGGFLCVPEAFGSRKSADRVGKTAEPSGSL